MSADTAYDRLLDALDGHGCRTRAKVGSAMAQCPAHEDRAPSLSLRQIEGQVLVHCFAGCETADVVAALGLTMTDLFDEPRGATYRYDDGRVVTRTPQKEFNQSGHSPGVVQLYRRAKVVDAVKNGVTVYLVEGEKDVHALEALGAVATTAPMGADAFSNVDASPLKGAHLVVVQDQDAAGERWLRAVLAAVDSIAAKVEVRHAAVGKDAADHVAAGHGVDDLVPIERPEPEPSSWARTDLGPVLDGTIRVEEPTLLVRTDGHALLYPGRVSELHGESESGKSFVVQAVAAAVLTIGGSVLYLDFESDAAAVVGRLRELGAPDEAIRDRFDYRRPEARPGESEWAALLAGRYDLAVIDGMTDALGTWGRSVNDNDEVAAWLRQVAKPIARRTGAAVVLIDHVTKSGDSRGRFAIGAQAKLAGLDGASYIVEVEQALGRGLRGVVSLRVAKDRPGSVRPHCGPWRKSDRTQEAARIVIDSTGGELIVVEFQPPATGVDRSAGPAVFRPTTLMEKASKYIEVHPACPTAQIASAVGGRKANVLTALDVLTAERWVREEAGPRSAKLYSSVKAYRQGEDPDSDMYVPEAVQDREQVEDDEDPLEGPGPVPVPRPGNGEQVGRHPLHPFREQVGTGREQVEDEPESSPGCAVCGAPLLLPLPGRTVCGRCDPTPITARSVRGHEAAS